MTKPGKFWNVSGKCLAGMQIGNSYVLKLRAVVRREQGSYLLLNKLDPCAWSEAFEVCLYYLA